MELWIHGGLNKTGSSFLQVQLEINACFLRTKGISYTQSRAGSGNAAPISFALRRSKFKRVQALLESHRKVARRSGCERVLLSSELFYHDIADPRRRTPLLSAIKAAGFDQPQLLLFFREPSEHAISCFCHRSGLKALPPFEQWISDQYEFPKELKRFLHAVDKGLGMSLTAIPYSADRLLYDCCGWLKISNLPKTRDQRFNQSVNAFEARMLSWLHKVDPKAAKRIRATLKALPREEKYSDQALKSQWGLLAAERTRSARSDLARLIPPSQMRINEEGAYRRREAGSQEIDLGEIRMTEAQLNAVFKNIRQPPWYMRPAESAYSFVRHLRNYFRIVKGKTI